jgi:hypothetical protein
MFMHKPFPQIALHMNLELFFLLLRGRTVLAGEIWNSVHHVPFGEVSQRNRFKLAMRVSGVKGGLSDCADNQFLSGTLKEGSILSMAINQPLPRTSSTARRG